MKNKKAAIELSIGTIVIIVLAMSMLILGLVFIRTIFVTSTDSIKDIDQGVKSKINELFATDKKTIVIFPDSGLVKIKRGSRDSGFAVALGNTADTQATLQYEATMEAGECPSTVLNDVTMIAPGQSSDIVIDAKRAMQNPIHIIFSVPENAPLCTFTVKIVASGDATETTFMSVEIES
ncbi:hypothetical protein J4402_04600 [Candidatus Pacearchaeota archaeon]|nr:hypothetical protein [Candidatus Pacearchaeota archaeon]